MASKLDDNHTGKLTRDDIESTKRQLQNPEFGAQVTAKAEKPHHVFYNLGLRKMFTEFSLTPQEPENI